MHCIVYPFALYLLLGTTFLRADDPPKQPLKLFHQPTVHTTKKVGISKHGYSIWQHRCKYQPVNDTYGPELIGSTSRHNFYQLPDKPNQVWATDTWPPQLDVPHGSQLVYDATQEGRLAQSTFIICNDAFLFAVEVPIGGFHLKSIQPEADDVGFGEIGVYEVGYLPHIPTDGSSAIFGNQGMICLPTPHHHPAVIFQAVDTLWLMLPSPYKGEFHPPKAFKVDMESASRPHWDGNCTFYVVNMRAPAGVLKFVVHPTNGNLLDDETTFVKAPHHEEAIMLPVGVMDDYLIVRVTHEGNTKFSIFRNGGFHPWHIWDSRASSITLYSTAVPRTAWADGPLQYGTMALKPDGELYHLLPSSPHATLLSKFPPAREHHQANGNPPPQVHIHVLEKSGLWLIHYAQPKDQNVQTASNWPLLRTDGDPTEEHTYNIVSHFEIWPSSQMICNDLMWFFAYNPTTRATQLWRTNGFEEGTTVIEELKITDGRSKRNRDLPLANQPFFGSQCVAGNVYVFTNAGVHVVLAGTTQAVAVNAEECGMKTGLLFDQRNNNYNIQWAEVLIEPDDW
eukprot:TRINITY_DN20542_c0_g1_i1.p1 TRINITY_DN20542_c0_g1~~TRINITY_DN20542_c0_g1_i1.p1  ORF type:complete len:565 (+),score=26.83 TRINITY_DN20542_c0_g1_i1:167-1861(+)